MIRSECPIQPTFRIKFPVLAHFNPNKSHTSDTICGPINTEHVVSRMWIDTSQVEKIVPYSYSIAYAEWNVCLCVRINSINTLLILFSSCAKFRFHGKLLIVSYYYLLLLLLMMNDGDIHKSNKIWLQLTHTQNKIEHAHTIDIFVYSKYISVIQCICFNFNFPLEKEI